MDVLLNIKEASTYLKCSKWTIYRIVKRGEISFIRHRRKILFKEQDLETYVNKDRIEARLNFNLKKAVNNLTNMPPVVIDKTEGGQKVARKKTRHNYGYGSVYKRKRCRFWSIDYYDADGNRVQQVIEGATYQEEAHEALNKEVFDAHFRKQKKNEQKKQVTFKELADMYLSDWAKNNKLGSWRTDEGRIKKMKEFFKDASAVSITSGY